MIAVVTGGAGFIGSNLAAALIEAGRKVRIIDNFSTGRRENVDALEGDFELFEGDIRDRALLEEAFSGAELVFHQAALPSVARSVEDPAAAHDVNATGTLNVLLAARDADVRRVVFASSSSVYGDAPELPKREEMKPAPLSPYAVSKITGEYYCRIFPELYGLETVALRYFNVFGPHQDPASEYAAVVPLFITRVLAGTEVLIHGDGGQSRDFTYIENVVRANLLAAEAEGASGEVFNVGYGEAASVNELFETVCRVAGKQVETENSPPRAGDVRHSLADISKARRILGYDPQLDLEAGLARTVAYFRGKV